MNLILKANVSFVIFLVIDLCSSQFTELLNQNIDEQAILSNRDLLTIFESNGQVLRRIRFDGIAGKETNILNENGEPTKLWEVSNRIDTVLRLFYSPKNELTKCFRLNDWESAITLYNEALIDLVDDEHSLNYLNQLNYTWQTLNETSIPADLRPMLQFDRLSDECIAIGQTINLDDHLHIDGDDESQENGTEHLNRHKRAISDWLIAPNTKWCGRGQTADKYSQLGGASKADKCCRRHDHCKFNIYAMTTKWQLFNMRPFTISHCNCDMRHRRDLSNFLRVPNTKWCGKGYSAKNYAELGGHSKADRCCRQHDKACPFWIMGFDTKYGYFNWRINTLMHCKCDERFRTCLKMADTADATMVGKLFFNIVQTKCFVLKPEHYCKRYSKSGDCEEETVRKRAYLRNNKKF